MIENTTDERNFYLNEREIQSRKNINEKHLMSLRVPLDETVKELEVHGDWKVLPYNEIQKKYNIVPVERSIFLQELQRHKNVIVQPSQILRTKDGRVTQTTPLEYKYVSEDTKEELGLYGVFYRRVSEQEELVDFLKDKKLKNNLADTLGILDYLYSKEADKGWIAIEAIKMIAETGISLDRAAASMDELEKLGLIVRGSIPWKRGRVKPVCIIVKDEEALERRTEEIDNSTNIILHEPVKKKRRRRKLVEINDENIEEATTTIEEKEEVKIGQPDKKSYTLFEMLESITEKVKEKESNFEKQGKFIEKLARECEGFKSKIDALEKINQRKSSEIEALVRFNNSFVANAQNEMMIMSGRFMTLMEEFSKLQHHQFKNMDTVNAYRGRAMEIVGDASKRITEFKEDRIPPALK